MRIVAAALLLMAATSAQAMEWRLLEWRLGVSYASGLTDVTDLYEDNLRAAGFDVNVDLKFPVGVAAGVRYDWTSGIRADVGLGPVFLIGGDVEHSEVPLSATVGYNFMRLSDISPYVRGGLVHHFVSGDLYSSSTPGFLLAAGVDFTHVSVELAVDTSEVEFDSLICNAGAACQRTKTNLNTYDFLASVYWRFH
jgi:hypothetical protein